MNERRSVRIKIRNVLWRYYPRASDARITWTTDAIMDVIGRYPLALLEDEPVPGCACWLCVLRLNAWVAQHNAIMRVERESMEEYD